MKWKKAIELDPNNVNSYGNRGWIKNKLKDYYGAITDFNKIIELDPNDALAYANRADAKYNLKDEKGACEDIKKARELDPNNDIFFNRWKIYCNPY